jgi:hypothetical protein
MYDHLPIEKRVYIEETLDVAFIQDADFFTNVDDLRLAIKRSIGAAEELAHEARTNDLNNANDYHIC